MIRRTTVVLAALAVVFVAVVVGVVFVTDKQSSGPPPEASGAGVFRVHAAILANGGQRAPQSISSDGAAVKVSLGQVSDNKASLALTGTSGQTTTVRLGVGGSATVDGAKVTVRTVWAGPDDHDDLVDVQLSAGG